MTIEIKTTAKDKCCPFCGSHNIEADFDFYDWDEELALGLSCSECQTTGPEVAIGYFIYCYLRGQLHLPEEVGACKLALRQSLHGSDLVP